jgi:hypothetical protein
MSHHERQSIHFEMIASYSERMEQENYFVFSRIETILKCEFSGSAA